jgi:hypothetical protein
MMRRCRLLPAIDKLGLGMLSRLKSRNKLAILLLAALKGCEMPGPSFRYARAGQSTRFDAAHSKLFPLLLQLSIYQCV